MNALRPMILRSAAAQFARQNARSKATAVTAKPGAVPVRNTSSDYSVCSRANSL